VDGADIDGVGQRGSHGVEEVVRKVHPEARVLLQVDQARQLRVRKVSLPLINLGSML
jgi:hypothetical protein